MRRGIAHADGNTVLFLTSPGGAGAGGVRTRKKKLIHTSLVKVEQAQGADARSCPHFQVCGDRLQHIEISEQVRLRKDSQRDASRLEEFPGRGDCEHTAPTLRYRNRAQWLPGSAAAGA